MSELLDGQYLHKRVRVTATVSDIFFDEITPRWIYLDLADGSNHVTAALIVGGPAPILEKDDTDTMFALKLGLEKGYRRFYVWG